MSNAMNLYLRDVDGNSCHSQRRWIYLTIVRERGGILRLEPFHQLCTRSCESRRTDCVRNESAAAVTSFLVDSFVSDERFCSL